MSEADSPIDDSDPPPPERGGGQTIVWALLFLLVVGGGSYAIRYVYRGATIVVEADAAAAAVLSTATVTLREVDGLHHFTLRPGEQTVPPGRYRIDVDWEETTLTFSTGETIDAKRGARMTIQVQGESVDP